MMTTRRGSLAAAFALGLWTTTAALAQGPGGPGGPGGGGPGGRGGFGRGGQSVLQLVQNPAVQEEIKLTDPQKEKIAAIDTASRAKRNAMRAAAGFGNRNGGPGGPGGNNANGGGNNNGNGNNGGNNNGGNNNGGGRGGRGGNRGGGNGNGGNNGGNGNGGNNPAIAQNGGGNGQGGAGGFGPGGFGPGGFGPGGPGGFGPGGPGGFGANMTDEQRAQMQEMFAAMQKLDKDTETAVLRVLDPKQRTRVSQIKLQGQGLNAFRTPELINALKIPEIRAQEISDILDGQNQARRDAFGQMREVFAQFAGNNGNNGGRPNRQQMQDLMANPEFQAKRDAVQKKIDAATATLEETTKAQIARLLTKKQRDQYDKMLGEPFDIAKLNQGRRGPGGPNGGNNPNPPADANADAAAKPAAPSAPAAPAATGTQPARKSLRDRRSASPG